ncbi:hypothetical protein D9615_000912 [Tricholomella constricta]|uniref:Uncharacterized protein n=1 Tax=Tricholomella constricta TaxID=117010 RepID=A0A8H5HKD6_9AGAR|nr:hypothetical protein D9615_000912 [Tricholomella constricta]
MAQPSQHRTNQPRSPQSNIRPERPTSQPDRRATVMTEEQDLAQLASRDVTHIQETGLDGQVHVYELNPNTGHQHDRHPHAESTQGANGQPGPPAPHWNPGPSGSSTAPVPPAVSSRPESAPAIRQTNPRPSLEGLDRPPLSTSMPPLETAASAQPTMLQPGDAASAPLVNWPALSTGASAMESSMALPDHYLSYQPIPDYKTQQPPARIPPYVSSRGAQASPRTNTPHPDMLPGADLRTFPRSPGGSNSSGASSPTLGSPLPPARPVLPEARYGGVGLQGNRRTPSGQMRFSHPVGPPLRGWGIASDTTASPPPPSRPRMRPVDRPLQNNQPRQYRPYPVGSPARQVPSRNRAEGVRNLDLIVNDQQCSRCGRSLPTSRQIGERALGTSLHVICQEPYCRTVHCRGCLSIVDCPRYCNARHQCGVKQCCPHVRAIAIFEYLSTFDHVYLQSLEDVLQIGQSPTRGERLGGLHAIFSEQGGEPRNRFRAVLRRTLKGVLFWLSPVTNDNPVHGSVSPLLSSSFLFEAILAFLEYQGHWDQPQLLQVFQRIVGLLGALASRDIHRDLVMRPLRAFETSPGVFALVWNQGLPWDALFHHWSPENTEKDCQKTMICYKCFASVLSMPIPAENTHRLKESYFKDVDIHTTGALELASNIDGHSATDPDPDPGLAAVPATPIAVASGTETGTTTTIHCPAPPPTPRPDPGPGPAFLFSDIYSVSTSKSTVAMAWSYVPHPRPSASASPNPSTSPNPDPSASPHASASPNSSGSSSPCPNSSAASTHKSQPMARTLAGIWISASTTTSATRTSPSPGTALGSTTTSASARIWLGLAAAAATTTTSTTRIGPARQGYTPQQPQQQQQQQSQYPPPGRARPLPNPPRQPQRPVQFRDREDAQMHAQREHHHHRRVPLGDASNRHRDTPGFTVNGVRTAFDAFYSGGRAGARQGVETPARDRDRDSRLAWELQNQPAAENVPPPRRRSRTFRRYDPVPDVPPGSPSSIASLPPASRPNANAYPRPNGPAFSRAPRLPTPTRGTWRRSYRWNPVEELRDRDNLDLFTVKETRCSTCNTTIIRDRSPALAVSGAVVHLVCPNTTCRAVHCRGCMRSVECPIYCNARHRCQVKSCCPEVRAMAIFEHLANFDLFYLHQLSTYHQSSMAPTHAQRLAFLRDHVFVFAGQDRKLLSRFREELRCALVVVDMWLSPHTANNVVHPSVGPVLASSFLFEVLLEFLRADVIWGIETVTNGGVMLATMNLLNALGSRAGLYHLFRDPPPSCDYSPGLGGWVDFEHMRMRWTRTGVASASEPGESLYDALYTNWVGLDMERQLNAPDTGHFVRLWDQLRDLADGGPRIALRAVEDLE